MAVIEKRGSSSVGPTFPSELPVSNVEPLVPWKRDGVVWREYVRVGEIVAGNVAFILWMANHGGDEISYLVLGVEAIVWSILHLGTMESHVPPDKPNKYNIYYRR